MTKVECFVLMFLLTMSVALAAPPGDGSGGAPRGVRSDASGNTIDSTNALTGFTMSNPYCYQPDPQLNQCSINFRYIQATDNQTSAPYLSWLAVTISSKVRLSLSAFFEGTITYSYDMTPGGLKVPCGSPNAGGAGTAYGNVYAVTVQPLDSTRNPMSTDTASITCPAYSP
jgi:hypothetical protein